MFKTPLLSTDVAVFGSCLENLTTVLVSKPNDCEKWILVSRKFPDWIGFGDLLKQRKEVLKNGLFRFANKLKERDQRHPTQPAPGNW